MALGLLGQKVGMTQVFTATGDIEPVTVIELGPCPVLQVRTTERDGYEAVQLGYKDKPRKNAIRAEQGHVATNLSSKRKAARQQGGVVLLPKANCEPQKFVREFRVAAPTVAVGELLNVKLFEGVKSVDVTALTKGRGTQGVMKRHNFQGMPAAHGAKKVHRQAGSTSSLCSNRGTGRPKKGLKRAGRYGNEQVTIRNLKVISIDLEKNLLIVRGGIPGFNSCFVLVKPTNVK